MKGVQEMKDRYGYDLQIGDRVIIVELCTRDGHAAICSNCPTVEIGTIKAIYTVESEEEAVVKIEWPETSVSPLESTCSWETIMPDGTQIVKPDTPECTLMLLMLE